jgi:hypothetical protein
MAERAVSTVAPADRATPMPASLPAFASMGPAAGPSSGETIDPGALTLDRGSYAAAEQTAGATSDPLRERIAESVESKITTPLLVLGGLVAAGGVAYLVTRR